MREAARGIPFEPRFTGMPRRHGRGPADSAGPPARQPPFTPSPRGPATHPHPAFPLFSPPANPVCETPVIAASATGPALPLLPGIWAAQRFEYQNFPYLRRETPGISDSCSCSRKPPDGRIMALWFTFLHSPLRYERRHDFRWPRLVPGLSTRLTAPSINKPRAHPSSAATSLCRHRWSWPPHPPPLPLRPSGPRSHLV